MRVIGLVARCKIQSSEIRHESHRAHCLLQDTLGTIMNIRNDVQLLYGSSHAAAHDYDDQKRCSRIAKLTAHCLLPCVCEQSKQNDLAAVQWRETLLSRADQQSV